VGTTLIFAAAKGASMKDAISQLRPGVGLPALLASLKLQNEIIAGIAEAAYQAAEGVRILLRDAAAASRRHPIMHSSH